LPELRVLFLSFNELSEEIPAWLADLTRLEQLALRSNKFKGNIPKGLGNLASLQVLDLSYNRLTGPVPPELGNLTNLQELGLSRNQLSGSIPPELGDLTNLQVLGLDGNQLSGSIPPELGSLTSLQWLNLQENQLTGEIPFALGNLTNLVGLSLGNNALSGRIPPELGNLTNLVGLSLGNNALSGRIPPELGNLTNLQFLDLSNNRLTGTIPATFGNLQSLEQLDVGLNRLSGEVPALRGNLFSLMLDSNLLSGPLPLSLMGLREQLRTLWFDDTYLCIPEDQEFQDWLWSCQYWGACHRRGTRVSCGSPDWPNTNVGNEVPFHFGRGAEMVFGSVTTSGNTTLAASVDPLVPELPNLYVLGVYYDITTTAQYDPARGITITLPYDDTGLTPEQEATVSLLHYEDGQWVDCTVSRDTIANFVTGHVSSLSWFAVAFALNQPPTVNAGGPYSVEEGGNTALTATGSDPDGDLLTYAWDLDGDGAFEAPGQAVTFSATALDGPSSPTVVVQVSDGKGGVATGQAIVDVLNAAPLAGSITAPVDPVPVGTTISVGADFTDPGALDTHIAEWNWGDGSSSAGAVTEVGGSGTVAGTHIYTTPGVYTVRLTVTDDDGGVGEALFQYVVVYDPEGGFVTGGGWINSPPGAYVANPSLTGKATFGFVAKYKKGATVPTGQTQFQFKVANLDFHSDTYQWLVVAGPQAKFKGVGTINGQGEYGFLLTAIDGQVSSSGGVDKFRIKIWDKATGEIVYDNQMGESDDSAAATELGGGSIVIHKQ
jgi:Leucine-rich repeat (LRR) protein